MLYSGSTLNCLAGVKDDAEMKIVNKERWNIFR